ncbi:MAG TPA: DUF3667 domain-containing protein [Luteimonas sp.]|nr:DUF3667 domain-containing protein [Luteimonas sp.]
MASGGGGDTPRDAPAPGGIPVAAADPIHDAWFDAPTCLNCGASLATPWCGQCGQARARRLAWGDLRRETWSHWRLFERLQASTLVRLLVAPGHIARGYVLGRRKDTMHPLKLLLFVVALLAVMVATSGYFEHHGFSSRADPALARMAALVQSYANWSFTLGIFAIFASSALVFRRRQGYNLVEHGVLAVYCQVLVMVAFLVALLPTLAWDSPAFIAAYKVHVGRWMTAVRLLVVAVAFTQFFGLRLRRDGWRLAIALAVCAGATWGLRQLYAHAILRIVQSQLA